MHPGSWLAWYVQRLKAWWSVTVVQILNSRYLYCHVCWLLREQSERKDVEKSFHLLRIVAMAI